MTKDGRLALNLKRMDRVVKMGRKYASLNKPVYVLEEMETDDEYTDKEGSNNYEIFEFRMPKEGKSFARNDGVEVIGDRLPAASLFERQNKKSFGKI